MEVVTAKPPAEHVSQSGARVLLRVFDVRERLAALQRSAIGGYVAKFFADRGMDLAMLVAWGTLSTVFPVLLGVAAIAGFLLRDPQRAADAQAALVRLAPPEAAQPLAGVLSDTQNDAQALGLAGLGLLLFNGSNLFANLESVFNRAYHVADRDLVGERLVSVLMLVIVTALLLVSTVAYSLGGVLSSASEALVAAVPLIAPVRGLGVLVVGYGLSLLSAFVTFVLLYTILPNRHQSIRQVVPGAALAAVLFLVILEVFPLYTSIFGQGFQTYAIFGTFLLLMFWTFLLGIVLVLGVELNAFLELGHPSQASALPVSAETQPSSPRPARPIRRAQVGGRVGPMVAALLDRRRSA
ncbi:MAG: YihY/virulence factor BrkB family protein [Chloroflexi bacterium]|nr:YihY/virulence factor BrkB family protein [Chloroflexota bacterium]